MPARMCTIEQARFWCQVGGADGQTPTDPTTEDVQILALIDAVTRAFQDYTGRVLFMGTLVERYNGTGGTKLMLRQFPVSTVTKVVIEAGASGIGGTIPVKASVLGSGLQGWRLDAAGGWLDLVGGPRWERGVQNIEVTYTAGFLEVPADLADAAAQQVGYAYGSRIRLGHRSISQMQTSTTYIVDELLPAVKARLDRYVDQAAMLSGGFGGG